MEVKNYYFLTWFLTKCELIKPTSESNHTIVTKYRPVINSKSHRYLNSSLKYSCQWSYLTNYGIKNHWASDWSSIHATHRSRWLFSHLSHSSLDSGCFLLLFLNDMNPMMIMATMSIANPGLILNPSSKFEFFLLDTLLLDWMSSNADPVDVDCRMPFKRSRRLRE